MDRVTLGIVGCGTISDVYFEAANGFDVLETAACADLETERAEAKADQYGVPTVATTEELLDDPEIDVAVILTPPSTHGDLLVRALESDTHAYTEKPLAASMAEGREILRTANENDLLVGSAPDTVLGTGLQTCRDVLEAGQIGEPVGAVASWANHGHEHWHPNPDLYYQEGGGPLFDMGPYYLTALVGLLGPVSAVAGATHAAFTERTITSDPRQGETIDVDVPTHETGTLTFENGTTGTLLMSFDVWESTVTGFEIYGTEGTLELTNPNRFDGAPRVHVNGQAHEVSVTREQPGQQRGLGLLDLAYALETDWEHRTRAELGLHVLEIMEGIRDSGDANEYVELSTAPKRPPSVPDGFPNER